MKLCGWVRPTLAVLPTLLAITGVLNVHAQESGTGLAQTACSRLASLPMAHASVAKAQWLDASVLPSPLADPGNKANRELPPHCAVEVVSTPVPHSLIHITLWLPAKTEWNGMLLATGNGGYSSRLSLPDMADGLRRGYAVGGSDTGHTGDELSFGSGHPEKIRDWAYRATHELAVAEAAVSKQLYGRAPAHAFFRGCSTGGQQALSEAQRYPEDFDGIVAGDPGNDRIRLNADFVTSWVAAHPEGVPPLSHAKLPLLAKAVVQTCDKIDGVEDGVIDDPRACHFDPGALSCKQGEDPDQCLTATEVSTVRTLYAGTTRNAAGEPLYFGWPRGSELGWGAYILDPHEPAREEFWTCWVYPGTKFDPRRFPAEAAIADARKMVPYVEATSADLNPFARRGGKLLLYHGWADSVVPPEDTIAYVDRVKRTTSGDSVALFMVPGMGHCGGGPGETVFDALGALETWVHSGVAPATMLARKADGSQTRVERPLCKYPNVARWNGHGDVAQASSFACIPPGAEVSTKP